MSEFNATKYKNDFQKENYDRLIINVPKGQKQVIQAFAKSQGKSLNGFVTKLIYKAMEEAGQGE